MKPSATKMNIALAMLIAGSLAAIPAMADKPNWAGSDKYDNHNKHDKKDQQGKDERKNERKEQKHEQRSEQRDDRRGDNEQARRDGDRPSDGRRGHFEARQHALVRDYYGNARGGRCPPGLAKKNNGCMPPGQAKKWHYGQPLPRDVVYYPVPDRLVIQIGMPPSGYRYVRVAGDILMIAIGSGLVVDAIQDLGRM